MYPQYSDYQQWYTMSYALPDPYNLLYNAIENQHLASDTKYELPNG